MNRREFMQLSAAGLIAASAARSDAQAQRPNVLWIVVEDASPHIGCYGETTIDTPNIDALAAEGVRFENAFVTCPVCSPARSAMVTGMYQTSIGSHNHRSQVTSGKGGGNIDYYDSYTLPADIPMVSDLFRDAGYYTCNGANPDCAKAGKTDYNFVNAAAPYDGVDWRVAPDGKPFYAQIQLSGGKWRKGSIATDSIEIPPYYPDDEVMRKDWAEYLASWVKVDEEVGKIVTGLKDAAVYDNTLIAFITDHGISHARGKQFLYEEGIRIPMILRLPGGADAGTVRDDLALHIDLAPISLAFAGAPIPDHLEGHDLLSANHKPRDFVVSARDRCDETIDVIRCVRTPRYKYIRNFLSYRPHLQRNQYKDGKPIVQHLRALHEKEALTPFQNQIFDTTRAPEELYDLQADPNEMTNLAGDPEFDDVLHEQRKRLYDWMGETRDPGLIPEPILEALGKKHGSKYAAMQSADMDDVIARAIDVISSGEHKRRGELIDALADTHPAVRYWAVTWLGNLMAVEQLDAMKALTKDSDDTVRLAAHLALCKTGQHEAHLLKLVEFVEHPNRILGMYAMNAIEQTGVLNDEVAASAQTALDTPYEFTQRYGRRLLSKCEAL